MNIDPRNYQFLAETSLPTLNIYWRVSCFFLWGKGTDSVDVYKILHQLVDGQNQIVIPVLNYVSDGYQLVQDASMLVHSLQLVVDP